MSLILVVRASRVWQKEWEERSRAHIKERMDVAAWIGRGFRGRMGTCTCMVRSLHSSSEPVTTL